MFFTPQKNWEIYFAYFVSDRRWWHRRIRQHRKQQLIALLVVVNYWKKKLKREHRERYLFKRCVENACEIRQTSAQFTIDRLIDITKIKFFFKIDFHELSNLWKLIELSHQHRERTVCNIQCREILQQNPIVRFWEEWNCVLIL